MTQIVLLREVGNRPWLSCGESRAASAAALKDVQDQVQRNVHAVRAAEDSSVHFAHQGGGIGGVSWRELFARIVSDLHDAAVVRDEIRDVT